MSENDEKYTIFHYLSFINCNNIASVRKNIIFAITISATPLYNAYQGGTYFLYTYGNIY